MYIFKYNLILIIICSFFFTAKAEFNVSLLSQPSGRCNGQLQIVADGTAGPFTIEIYDNTRNWNIPIFSKSNVQGEYIFSAICQNADVSVFAINRFGCSQHVGDIELGVNAIKNEEESSELKNQENDSDVFSGRTFTATPNPFTDQLNINLGNESNVESISLINSVGTVVNNINTNSISELNNLDNLPSGVYFIKVRTNDGTLVDPIKVIKE